MIRTDTLRVYLTIDTEIWCQGWQELDAKFPDAFSKYIFGRTPYGDFGLPFILDALSHYKLKAVFFVEPLFSLRFGPKPLEEIVRLIRSRRQSVELHLHTEWADEAIDPIFEGSAQKKQHIRQFSYTKQRTLIERGRQLLLLAGTDKVNAFRAGNFGASDDTLRALASTGIPIDSSYNPVASPCSIQTSNILLQATRIDDILELPMSVFIDGISRPRPASITACSFNELRFALIDAFEKGWKQFVILSHSFEFLNRRKTHRNSVVARRFLRICEFLANNSDKFSTADFRSTIPEPFQGLPESIRCSKGDTALRLVEQILSRVL